METKLKFNRAGMKLPIHKIQKEATKAIGFRLPESKAEKFNAKLDSLKVSVQDTLESVVDMILSGELEPEIQKGGKAKQ